MHLARIAFRGFSGRSPRSLRRISLSALHPIVIPRAFARMIVGCIPCGTSALSTSSLWRNFAHAARVTKIRRGRRRTIVCRDVRGDEGTCFFFCGRESMRIEFTLCTITYLFQQSEHFVQAMRQTRRVHEILWKKFHTRLKLFLVLIQCPIVPK